MTLYWRNFGEQDFEMKDVESIEDMDLLHKDCRLQTAKRRISFYSKESWLKAKKFFTEDCLPMNRYDDSSFFELKSANEYIFIFSACTSWKISVTEFPLRKK